MENKEIKKVRFFKIFCGRGVLHTPSNEMGVCDTPLPQKKYQIVKTKTIITTH